MRSVVLSNRIRHLLKMSSMGVLGVVVAGCSSGFQRFDSSIFDEGAPAQTAQNSYPGIDGTTTASAGRRLVPLNPVTPEPVPMGVYHQPEPTYAANQATVSQAPVYQQPAYQQPSYQQPAYQAPTNRAPSYQTQAVQQPQVGYTPPSVAYTPPKPDYQPVRNQVQQQAQSIQSTSLAKPEVKSYQQAVQDTKLSYTPPKPDSGTVYIPPAATDPTNTASVSNGPSREGGWTSTGGTRITVRQGETLYNLSKRYGVPVEAIRKANGLTTADGLQAGQQVVIPNYVFSRNSAISAPDNNPGTRAASAGTGYIGEAKTANVSIPTKRPEYYNAYAAEAGTVTPINTNQVSVVQNGVSSQQIAPISPITPTSVNSSGLYTVQSGDSLSKIAAQNGTNVAALKQANGLTGNNIQIGQKLTIPGAYDSTVTASVPEPTIEIPQGVDPIVTGSLEPSSGNFGVAEVDSDTPTPQRSGISQFRWPVRGRVVDDFGSTAGNTRNEGIDISVPEGTAVRAAENGVVIYTGSEISAYGNLILVRHDDDWVSAYAHNRDFEVKKGDKVRRGQIIARSGRTGNADRPKLHFELRKDSQAVNPMDYLAGA